MNVLLDTCTFLWLISDITKLSPAAMKELTPDPNIQKYPVKTAW